MSVSDTLQRQGFELIRGAVSSAAVEQLRTALGPLQDAGRRGLLDDSRIAAFANSDVLQQLVRPYVDAEPFAVRAIYFNKSPDANWVVAWHQDMSIAVRGRTEVAGFGPWSVKGKVTHVQPPMALLERMLTVRLHLDDVDEANGALRVVPASHIRGQLSPQAVVAARNELGEHFCTAEAGDALLMRPLLLHASGRSSSSRQRRVLHIEYACFDLPGELNWQHCRD